MGDWSDAGCKPVRPEDREKDIVLCRCNHLSTFGVLVVCNSYIATVEVTIMTASFIQNTQPVVCEDGYVPNFSVTDCVGQYFFLIYQEHLRIQLFGTSINGFVCIFMTHEEYMRQ